jgi:hypothetical protein
MLTLKIFDELEEEYDFDIEVIEEQSTRIQSSYNREIECDAVPMNNREEW